MKNCLVTKLKDVVSNNDLLKLNELRLKFYPRENLLDEDKVSKNIQIVLTTSVENVKMSILNGDAYFYQVNNNTHNNVKTITLEEKKEYVILIQASSSFTLSISNKNAIISMGNLNHSFISTAYKDKGKELLYATDIETEQLALLDDEISIINCRGMNVIGDIANLKELDKLSVFDTDNISLPIGANREYTNKNSRLYGDATFLLSKGLIRLFINETKLSGDITQLNPSSLIGYGFHSSKISGDIAKTELPVYLENTVYLTISTAMPYQSQIEAGYNIYGDLCEAINKSEKSSTIRTVYSSGLRFLTGNLATLPPNFVLLVNILGGSKFTYNDVGQPLRPIMVLLRGVDLGDDLDSYLIASSRQAVPDHIRPLLIDVWGNKTEASTEAVSILKEKGVNVIITPSNQNI